MDPAVTITDEIFVARPAENAWFCLIRDTSGRLTTGYAVSVGKKKSTRGIAAREPYYGCSVRR
jgi:hypothetical protein